MVARLDPGGELRRLSGEVLDERRELEKQLSRRRDFEAHLREARSQLEALRDERRRVEADATTTQRRIAHLQDELGFVEREVRAAEEDLQMLRESGGFSRESRRGPAPYSSADEERRDVISKVRAERELLQRDQKGIEELRVRLDEIFRQKLDAQMVQQSLLEKQRQAEQDRGLMLTAVEAERGKLSALRADRIKLWEERSVLEKELTDIAQERWLAEHQAVPDRNRAIAVKGPGVPYPSAFQSSPSEVQRRRGVPTEDQPPSVVFSSLPDEWEAERVGTSTLTAGIRRHTGDGFSGTRPEGSGYPGSGYDTKDRDPRMARADNRGIRNEVGGNLGAGGGWNSGFGNRSGSASGRSLRSQQTADFGTN